MRPAAHVVRERTVRVRSPTGESTLSNLFARTIAVASRGTGAIVDSGSHADLEAQPYNFSLVTFTDRRVKK